MLGTHATFTARANRTVRHRRRAARRRQRTLVGNNAQCNRSGAFHSISDAFSPGRVNKRRQRPRGEKTKKSALLIP